MSATPTDQLKPTTRTCIVALAALVVVVMIACGIGGCTRPSSSDWAQTSPIMNADKTTNAVNLGARD